LARPRYNSGILHFERYPVIRKYLLFATLLLLPAISRAQVAAAGRGGNQQLFAGGFFSDFSPVYGYQRLYGIGGFVDYNLTPRLGAEAEARFLRFNQLANIHEDTYMVGPKINYGHKKFVFYGKGLFGLGEFNFPLNAAHGGYFAIGLGGGVDYRLSRHFYARGEYEYQIWPGFVGPPDSATTGNRPNGLTPNGFSVGMSYRIF
jgi:opacity protein-like surface antigen